MKIKGVALIVVIAANSKTIVTNYSATATLEKKRQAGWAVYRMAIISLVLFVLTIVIHLLVLTGLHVVE